MGKQAYPSQTAQERSSAFALACAGTPFCYEPRQIQRMNERHGVYRRNGKELPMSVLELMQKRCSVRKFKDQPIERDVML